MRIAEAISTLFKSPCNMRLNMDKGAADAPLLATSGKCGDMVHNLLLAQQQFGRSTQTPPILSATVKTKHLGNRTFDVKNSATLAAALSSCAERSSEFDGILATGVFERCVGNLGLEEISPPLKGRFSL